MRRQSCGRAQGLRPSPHGFASLTDWLTAYGSRYSPLALRIGYSLLSLVRDSLTAEPHSLTTRFPVTRDTRRRLNQTVEIYGKCPSDEGHTAPSSGWE